MKKKKAIVAIIIIFFITGIAIFLKNKQSENTWQFMDMRKEFPISKLEPEQLTNFAWEGDMPEFIVKKIKKALTHHYIGIQYTYGENIIKIRTGGRVEVNDNIVTTWSSSLYSSGDNIAIYGYFFDEFRRIYVGKTKGNVKIEVLTPNVEIPISAHAIFAKEMANGYWLALNKNGYLSVYKNRMRIGAEVKLENPFLSMYVGSIICDEAGNLYMPYLVNNKGKTEFICPQISTLDKNEFENFQSMQTRLHDEVTISESVFPVFKQNGKITILLPNELEKFIQYENGEAELSVDDDLGWHYVEIE